MVTQCVQQVLHATNNSFAEQQQSYLSVADTFITKQTFLKFSQPSVDNRGSPTGSHQLCVLLLRHLH